MKKKVIKRKRNSDVNYYTGGSGGGGGESSSGSDPSPVIFIVIGAGFLAALAYLMLRDKSDADDDGNGNGDDPAPDIFGYVKDADGNSIAANVYLDTLSSGGVPHEKITTATAAGYYEFRDLDPESYYISADASGYRASSPQTVFADGMQVDITLLVEDVPPVNLQSQLSSIWNIIDFPIWVYRGTDPVPTDDADDWWGYDPDGIIPGYPELTELIAGDYVALIVRQTAVITTPTSGTVSLVPGEYSGFYW